MVVFSHSRLCDGKIPIKLTISAAERLGAPILLINRSNLTTCAMRSPIAHKSIDLPSKWGTHKESITQRSVPQYIVCVNILSIIFCAYILQRIFIMAQGGQMIQQNSRRILVFHLCIALPIPSTHFAPWQMPVRLQWPYPCSGSNTGETDSVHLRACRWNRA